MDRTAAMPTTTDEDPEVQGFTLGKLWDAFQNGIAMGRAREIMFESAPPPGPSSLPTSVPLYRRS